MHKKLQLRGSVQKVAGEENKYRVLASTSSIDRQGDSIDQSGWQLANYFKNPVMLWAHDYSELPIAKATNVEVTSKGLEMEFEFIAPEGNPKAAQVKYCYDNGFLNAVSVGFMCLERNGNIITRAELFEVSFVPVPANAEALRLALTEKSIDFSLIKEQLEKGEVANVLTEQEIMEQKYENLDEVFNVVYAFASVYCDPNTSVNDFGTLLEETVGLLSTLASGAGQKDLELYSKQLVKASVEAGKGTEYRATMLAKEGRTLSTKTLEKITAAVESMKTASTHLETLVADSAKDKSVEEIPADPIPPAPVENVDNEEGTLKSLAVAILESVQGQLRVADKHNESNLKLVNEAIEAFVKGK